MTARREETATVQMSATTKPAKTFAGFPFKEPGAVAAGDVVFLSASEGSPYQSGTPSHSANASRAIREASQSFAKQLSQFDFDLGRPMLGRGPAQYFDAGEIPTDAWRGEDNRERIRQTVRTVLAAGGKTVLLGGDDSVPIPWLQAHEGFGPFTVLQIDAHTDWADEIRGNRFGYGSPMRRASELDCVNAMVQVGARGLGSGGAWQIDDARAWGSHIVTAQQLRRQGVEAALACIAPETKVLISIDCDGLDPALFAAVNMPTPGGLSYGDLIDLFRGVAEKAEICGAAILEYVPERDDSHRLCGLTAARLGTVLAGLMV